MAPLCFPLPTPNRLDLLDLVFIPPRQNDPLHDAKIAFPQKKWRRPIMGSSARQPPSVRFHPAAMNRLTHVAQALTASPASAGDFRGALLLLYVVVILPGLHALTAAAVIPAW